MSFEQFAIALVRLRASVYVHHMLAPRLAREIAGVFEDTEADRRLCDRVMLALGYEHMRLGRVEFYVRDKGDGLEHRSNSRDADRAEDLRDARGVALREQLERRAEERERRRAA